MQSNNMQHNVNMNSNQNRSSQDSNQ